MQMMQKFFKVINQISDQADLQAIMNTVKNRSDEWLLKQEIRSVERLSAQCCSPAISYANSAVFSQTSFRLIIPGTTTLPPLWQQKF